jgi:hypothetical protein
MTSVMPALKSFKWPVSCSRVIAATQPEIWEVISSPGTLALYDPCCEKNPVFDWRGAHSHDEVHYFNGVVLERRFSSWYEDIGYDLEIGRSGSGSSVVSWRLSPFKDRNSSLEITIFPHAVQHIPVVARWLPHYFWLRPQLRRYLRSVLRGLEWFVIRGTPVRRNQFGSHRWFSPPIAAGNDDQK